MSTNLSKAKCIRGLKPRPRTCTSPSLSMKTVLTVWHNCINIHQRWRLSMFHSLLPATKSPFYLRDNTDGLDLQVKPGGLNLRHLEEPMLHTGRTQKQTKRLQVWIKLTFLLWRKGANTCTLDMNKYQWQISVALILTSKKGDTLMTSEGPSKLPQLGTSGRY